MSAVRRLPASLGIALVYAYRWTLGLLVAGLILGCVLAWQRLSRS